MPRLFVTFLADVARPPVALGGVAGVVLAVRALRAGGAMSRSRSGCSPPGSLAFVGTGIAGLSILPRYLTVPAVALCSSPATRSPGFTHARPPAIRWRRAWRGAAVAARGRRRRVLRRQAARASARSPTSCGSSARVHDDLARCSTRREVRDGMRCGPITFPNYRLVPDSRWMLDAPRSAVGARSARRRRARASPSSSTGEKSCAAIGFADGASPLTNVPGPGLRPPRPSRVTRGAFSGVTCARPRAASCPLRHRHAELRAGRLPQRAFWAAPAVCCERPARAALDSSGPQRSGCRAAARSAATKRVARPAPIVAPPRAQVRTPARSGETVRRPSRAYLRIR